MFTTNYSWFNISKSTCRHSIFITFPVQCINHFSILYVIHSFSTDLYRNKSFQTCDQLSTTLNMKACAASCCRTDFCNDRCQTFDNGSLSNETIHTGYNSTIPTVAYTQIANTTTKAYVVNTQTVNTTTIPTVVYTQTVNTTTIPSVTKGKAIIREVLYIIKK